MSYLSFLARVCLVICLPVTAALAQTSGSVGIGITTPTQMLDVNGGLLVRGYRAVNNQGAYLQWNRLGGDGATWLLNQQGQGAGGLVFGSVTTANALTEWGRFASNGYLGVGTSTPSSRLDLGPTYGSSPTDAATKKLAVYNNASGSDFYGLGVAGGYLHVFAGGASTAAPFLSISNGGNVGVGTSSPSQKLDVSGNSNVSGTMTVGGNSTVSGTLGVGTTAPAASAALDVTSTTQGLLLPRLTSTQMYAIATPVAGLLVYNTDANGFYGFKGPVAASTINQPTQDINTTPYNNFCQSFTAAATTNLTSVLLYNVSSTGNSSLTLTLYMGGNGPGGTVLYTATQPSSGAGAITFLLPGISVSSGQVYSFSIKRADGNNLSVAASDVNSDTYSGGSLFTKGSNFSMSAGNDMAFKLTFNTGAWQAL